VAFSFDLDFNRVPILIIVEVTELRLLNEFLNMDERVNPQKTL